MAQWYCIRCKTKFPSEYGYEHHNCPSDAHFEKPQAGVSLLDRIMDKLSSRSKPMSSEVTCGCCHNKMTREKFSNHACVKDGRETVKNVMKIALFVHSKRKDVRSMRLAATEFRGAQYLVRGVSTEDEFVKIAREMGSSIYVATNHAINVPVKDLNRSIMKKSDVCLMFPSKDDTDKKDTFKLTLDVDGHKVPTVVYPEA